MKYFLFFFLLLLHSNIFPQEKITLENLRQKLIQLKPNKLTIEQSNKFVEEALTLVDDTQSRSDFWNIIVFISDVYHLTPYKEAHFIREQAIHQLVKNYTHTMRWSSLLTESFLPNFNKIPKEEWEHEIDTYDSLFDSITKDINDKHILAELLRAKIYLRIYINRNWDWMTQNHLDYSIKLLDTLNEVYGDLFYAGSKSDRISDRTQIYYYELEKLHFGAKAPITKGIDVNEKPIDIKDYQGKIVVLDFWTSFCHPCLAMVPAITDFTKKHKDDPIAYVGINGDTERSLALHTIQRFNITWRNFWDGTLGTDGPLAQTWNVHGWPTIIILDAKGLIRYKITGENAENKLEIAIEHLLKEMKK